MPRANVKGAEIYYEEAGSGPPIILSPGGLNGLLETFRPVMEGLSQEHRVISYDRRFGGQSRSPMVVQTWDLVCQDLVDLMDALGIDQAYLGGGSFAPGISLGCAARYPKSCASGVPVQHRRWHHMRLISRGEAIPQPGHGSETGHEGCGSRP